VIPPATYTPKATAKAQPKAMTSQSPCPEEGRGDALGAPRSGERDNRHRDAAQAQHEEDEGSEEFR
jgi:hypothetical protein